MTNDKLLSLIEKAAREEWKELDLSGFELRELPSEIGNLTKLKSLILRKWDKETRKNVGNNLTSLPPEIVQLTSLQQLDLSDNQLSSLPPEIVQLISLQQLDLSDNQLSSLPAEIGQLTTLQQLNLSRNQLSSLPAEIGQLNSLQQLYLSYNRLSSLPAEIVQLNSLQQLDLSGNQLSSLPAEIVQLTSLQQLKLSGNQLSSLPAEIVQLKQLKQLDLRYNPVPIPPEILGGKELWEDPGDVKEILDFYFRILDPNETEPLYEAKLLIIGEGEAGKTSLAKKILDENYQLISQEKSTEGIDVLQWKIPLPNGHEFRVNIWDFGGQEIYHQTHQFFLTERSLYLLVADTRRESTNFYWWLKVAELLSGQSPIFIIKNEKQDRKCFVNEPQLRSEFPNLEKVFSTNLATNRGLQEIKKAIEFSITNLPHVGDASPLPKVWVRVRSALENDSRNYITLEEYYQLCQVNQLRDRQDMLRLSRYLHDLGICLHFQEDPTLKHYIILKPEWGTTAVYQVLDNQAVLANLGCFSQGDLADIWKDNQYETMRQELLQLMMRFKLCYPIPNRPQEYIAPQLLNSDTPTYHWDNSHNLILRYEYDFMPKGLLTRFIVETHPWIEKQQLVWKSGVVLWKNQTRAEVIENYNKKEIRVRISGSRQKELLAVVNYELEKIHRSFEYLKYKTLVPCNCSLCDGSDEPYAYALEDLHRRLNRGRLEVECQLSYEMVNVRGLIDGVNLPFERDLRETKPIAESALQQELERDKKKSFQTSEQLSNGDTTIINAENVYLQKAEYMSNPTNQPEASNTTKNYTFNDSVGMVDTTLNDQSQAIGQQYNEAPSQDLAEAAKQIQTILDQLSETYPSETKKEKRIFAVEAIDVIEQNSSLTEKLLSAAKAGSLAALDSLLSHPAASFVIAAIDDLQDE
ncbi:MAG: COR domain-containing protein [Crocosphaera sp.]